jgi:diguanylate cyclase (GGDEF)-like protein
MFWSAVRSRMGRRFAWVLLASVAGPLLLLVVLVANQAVDAQSRAGAERLDGLSRMLASQVAARLAAADSLARALLPADGGAGAKQPQQRGANSSVFKSIEIAQPGTRLGISVYAISEADRRALQDGRTLLLALPLDAQQHTIYLVRAVRSDPAARYAFFELSPKWLWGVNVPLAGETRLTIIDTHGTVLRAGDVVAPSLAKMFAQYAAAGTRRGAAAAGLGWLAGAEEWRGAAAHVELAPALLAASPWAVAAYEPKASFFAGTAGAWSALLLALVFAAAVSIAAAAYLAMTYLPALAALKTQLVALGEQRGEVRRISAADELDGVCGALASATRHVESRMRALEAIGEIDRLLLGTVAIEQVLDAILPRVQVLTRGHAVGVTLFDADSGGHARVYVASPQVAALPVSRVPLDDDMIETLAGAERGLTIARCEEGRHSFLRPLRELGAEFFWVWPVKSADRVLGALTVGYCEAPANEPQMVEHCGELASRLGVALSNSERDEQLYRQAHFDPLTALPNRLLFRDRLAQELATASAGISRGALLYVDLDHFKKVNDSVGHSAGDQLLTIIAQRLRSCVKEGDTVARLGGDEFTVILRNVADPDAARLVAERVIESVQLPVNVAGRDHYVQASVGITLFPDDGSTIDELMRNADVAMYRAKEAGRSRALFFAREMTVRPLPSTDSGLYRALRRREFALFYQPQFNVMDGDLAALEALLRWNSPRDGTRQPHEFVPAAEASGLIVDIGGWVLEVACSQLAIWREQGIAPRRLALNVSGQQLRDVDFARNVKRVLEKYGLPADLLELEFAESTYGEASSGQVFERLAGIGVRLALDNFGSGSSSLKNLRRHPIDVVKIDRSFVADVTHNSAAATLAETIIFMTHALGKRVVAEGVETAEQLDFLRERGCDFAQGFYLSRPLPVNAVTALLESRRMRDSSADMRATG